MSSSATVPEPLKCAIYLRVSLDRAEAGSGDERLAVIRQNAECVELAQKRGWEIARTYEDNSISATKAIVRPAYDRMVRDYEAGEFGAIVVWELDRLTRKPLQLEGWIDAAVKRGLQLVTGNGEADLSTESGILFARIKMAVAASEVALKSRRQLAASAQRRARGVVPSGVRLTGYDQAGAIIPAEAAAVVRVFDLFLAGQNLSQIARELTSDGVPTRSGIAEWPSSSVRTILTNPRYAGHAVLNGQSLGHLGNWSPIIDEITFTTVQNRLADPRRVTNRAGNTSRIHLGSGLFLCGTCHEPVRSNGPQYWCHRGPGHTARTRSHIDAFVLGLIAARLEEPDVAPVFELDDAPENAAAAAEVRRLRMRIEQIDSDYDDERIDGERHRVAIEKVRAKIQALSSGMVRASEHARMAEILSGGSPAEAFLSADLEAQREVINVWVSVTLLHAVQGKKGFDTGSVQIEWRR